MKPATEKKKVFVDLFREPLGEMGFSVKNNRFYKYSKKHRYLIGIEVSLFMAGTLKDILVTFGSNYAPIRCDGPSYIYGVLELDTLLCLKRENIQLWEETRKFDIRNDVPGFSEHLEYWFPRFMEAYGPLLRDIPSLEEYLGVEEVLAEKVYQTMVAKKLGCAKETAYGYLSLGDVVNAKRIAHKRVEFYRAGIRKYQEEYADRPELMAELIENETGRLHAAIALAEQIDSGSVSELMKELALRDEQSIRTCTQFFGERKYAGS